MSPPHRSSKLKLLQNIDIDIQSLLPNFEASDRQAIQHLWNSFVLNQNQLPNFPDPVSHNLNNEPENGAKISLEFIKGVTLHHTSMHS